MSFPLRKMSTAAGAPMRKMSTAGPNELLAAQIHNRRANDRAIIENPLGACKSELPLTIAIVLTLHESLFH